MDFQVSEILEGYIVAGRNGKADIPAGTVFTKIVKYKVDGDLNHMTTVCCGKVAGIELKLVTIRCFHEELDFIPGGHTAGLKLSGSGLDQLKKELENLQQGEYVHITA